MKKILIGKKVKNIKINHIDLNFKKITGNKIKKIFKS